jgi:predicted metalloprotease with PDZ domain
MKRCVGVFVLGLFACVARGQGPVTYRVQYAAPGDCCVRVQMIFSEPLKAPVALVMPRTYPGGYVQVLYDEYVKSITASGAAGKAVEVKRARDGPRWNIGKPGETVERIEYQVDVARMESQILSADQTSKVRRGYVGLLGYSVLAFVDGLEERAIKLMVNAPEGWPVLSTLAPTVPAATSNTTAEAPDYYTLADSQILMGPELQLRRLEGKIALILAVYSEAAVDLDLEGGFARKAMDAVQTYFGDTPFSQYTVQLEFLKPLAGHDYNFSQEHVNSGTFSFSTEWRSTVLVAEVKELMLLNYAHHMAHSWIPKRAYGEGYRPFTWELAPEIDTIWFNEGFGRYAGIEAVANGMSQAEAAKMREGELSWMREVVGGAPLFIKRMSLETLSREASFMYTVDFRLGKNIFSRGALMAAEMDDRIREKTRGEKSLRDALRALLVWSEKNRRAFQPDEMMGVFAEGTGVEVRDIYMRWREPLAK